MHFTFGSPYLLLLLLLLPCFFWCREVSRTYYFPKLLWVNQESPLWHREPWLKVLLFTLMVLALSKPFVYDAKETAHRKGRNLILAIDASGSMAQSGFDRKDRFRNRFESNIKLAKAFIQKRFDDNMGIVLFGTFAYTVSPLTYDLDALTTLLDMTHVGLAGESTAIGDAIMQSIHTLSYGKAKNRVVILLTDGRHNAGCASPKSAVAYAKTEGIKIYTIGIGKKSDFDSALLETIAKQSGGKSYAASSAEALSDIYAEIEKLEPSAIRSENYLNQSLLAGYPLGLVALLLLLWVLHAKKEAQ